MATALRQLIPLVSGAGLALVWLPLIPALYLLGSAALQAEGWLTLLADNQFFPALIATLVSSLIALVGALLLALMALAALWPDRGWQQYQAALPWLLALPHVAFASALWLLFGEGGLLGLSGSRDPYAIGLGIAMALKESGFLLWVMAALLARPMVQQQALVARSLGYSRGQTIRLLLPQILPGCAGALAAMAAWSLSAVDVALILGPGNPPTLGVLTWQWLNDADPLRQQQGLLASLVLLVLGAVLAALAFVLWRGFRHHHSLPVRHVSPRQPVISRLGAGLPLIATLLAVVILVMVATPDSFSLEPLWASLWLGVASTAIGLVLTLLWLEGGATRLNGLIWLPLWLPALPLVAGQYQLTLWAGLDGTGLAVMWSHLLWVIPYLWLVLAPAWQRIDPRLVLSARLMGWGRLRILCQLKLPLLARPLLAAFAVGFSVSIAQYLPTLYNGAGRISTLTTNAVALSSSGSQDQLAWQALLQALLPMGVFMLAAGAGRVIGHLRRGLS